MSTIAGSKNTLLGYGAALPNAAASNQIVIGTQAETTYIATGAGGGVIISQSALTLSGNTSLTVSGNAGTAGQYMVSGGTGQAPYWGPKAPQSLTGVNWTLAKPLSNLYTVQGDGNVEHQWSLTLPTAASAAGSSIWLKNMATASGTVGTSIVNEGATEAVEALLMSPGDSGNVESDGTNWYVLSANQAFALPTPTPTPTPTVTGISPSTGNMSGNTAVTITGTNFTGATAVTIGGAAVTSFTVTPDGTEITAVTPSGTAGSASVLVTNAVGTNTGNSLYTYANVSPATFAYKGANQTWQVPAGVTQVTATVAGSVGEKSGGLGGAGGCTISGTLTVTTGTTLNIICGGYDGSYAGSGYWHNQGSAPGYGGGYSAVLLNTATPVWQPAATGDIFIMAGGGGGSSAYAYPGGIGGYLQGGDGVDRNGYHATGGTQTQGGTGAQSQDYSAGVNGSLYQGGAGGYVNGGSRALGGGGGGGWYGGGGGSVGTSGQYVGGGGGSSYPVMNTDKVTIVSHTDGSNGGLGYVTLEWT